MDLSFIPSQFLKAANNKKILIIGGPTASGKTDLALKIAQKLNGELISSDSRQIYKGMDIGTGKDIPKSCKIPVYGLDLIKPNQQYSVAQWVDYCKKKINTIWKKDKLVIIVGGTGFWIKALLKGLEWGRVPPNQYLRDKLEKLKVKELRKVLKTHNKNYYKNLSKSDWQNKRRLLRRIVIAKYRKNNPFKKVSLKGIDKDIKTFVVYIDVRKKILKQKIYKRIEKRLKQGLLKEIKDLVKAGYSFSDPGLNTLGYKEFVQYFKKQSTDQVVLDRAIFQWKVNEWHYAKRQLVWWKKEIKGGIVDLCLKKQ